MITKVMTMKRFIKSSFDKNDRVLRLEIIVEYEFEEAEEQLAASTIFSINDKRNKSNNPTMIEFHEFLVNIFGILESYDFVVKEHHWSDRKNSKSYYFNFYPTDESKNIRTEFFITLRISDYDIANMWKQSIAYRKQMAKQYSMSPSRQKTRFKQVIINNKTWSNYHGALLYIDDVCDRLEHGDYEDFHTK